MEALKRTGLSVGTAGRIRKTVAEGLSACMLCMLLLACSGGESPADDPEPEPGTGTRPGFPDRESI
jgi:hypothetical protein